MLWENLREEEFDAAIETAGKVCVVPIGCLEMHGQHLPVGTDAQTAYYVAKKAAELEDVCVFPPLYFGDVSGLTMWRGAIIFSLELLQRMLTELCDEIARNGFKKIVLLNGHGGNVHLLQNFIRSTKHQKKDYVVLTRNEYCYSVTHLSRELSGGVKFPELTEQDKQYVTDFVAAKKTYGHGGINETSIILKINPDAVRMDRMHAVNGLSRKRTAYLGGTGFEHSPSLWLEDFPDSYEGDYSEGASERIGEVILRRRIEAQARACRLLKQDDRLLDWNNDWNNSWI